MAEIIELNNLKLCKARLLNNYDNKDKYNDICNDGSIGTSTE